MPIENLDPEDAEKIVRRKRCSESWKVLTIHFDLKSHTATMLCTARGTRDLPGAPPTKSEAMIHD